MFLKIEQNVLFQGIYGSIFLCWMSGFKLSIRHASQTAYYIDLSFQIRKKVKTTVPLLNLSEKWHSRKLCCMLDSPFVWGWVKWADDLQENESSKGLPWRVFNHCPEGRMKQQMHLAPWDVVRTLESGPYATAWLATFLSIWFLLHFMLCL